MWQCHISASECRCYRLNGFSLLKRLPLSADAAGSRVLEQSVGEWLEHVGFPQYESKLLLNGFDDLRFMVSRLLCPCDDSDELENWNHHLSFLQNKLVRSCC